MNTDRVPSAGHRILVCDDDSLFRKTLSILLRDYGEIVNARDTDEAVALLGSRSFDLVLLDVQLRTADEGIRALPAIRRAAPETSVIMLSGLRDFAAVRGAMNAGADDYLVKDFDPEEFRITVERVLGKRRLEENNRRRDSEAKRAARKYRFIGENPRIAEIRRLVEKFRNASANVLIQGETGVGKEIVARLLRRCDERGEFEPFVAVDSATLHAHTAESTLFGHERGAFTGAEAARKGLFEEADGGAVFFDEIANMPLSIQAKLLRAIQEQEIVRLGSTRIIPLRFRVIAATNRPLEALAERGEFLPDLLQRLNVLPIHIPPLRERRDDIPLLARHFLDSKAPGASITGPALEALRAYNWPGNARELAAFIDYALAVSDDRVIDLADFPPKLAHPSPDVPARSGDPETFYEAVARFESNYLRQEYARNAGNVSQLALRLGMDRSHLYSKLKQHGIHAPRSP